AGDARAASDAAGVRLCAPRQSLAGDEHVGNDGEVLETELGAGSTEPGHHFIEQQQNAVLVAERAYAWPVLVGRDDRATARTRDRLPAERPVAPWRLRFGDF